MILTTNYTYYVYKIYIVYYKLLYYPKPTKQVILGDERERAVMEGKQVIGVGIFIVYDKKTTRVFKAGLGL